MIEKIKIKLKEINDRSIKNIYNSWSNILIYVLSFSFLIIILATQTPILYWIMISIFFVWDMGYVLNPEHFYGREPTFLLKQISEARTTMSYFLVFQGLLITGIISNSELQNEFRAVIRQSNLPTEMIFISVIVSAISMLFIPIQLKPLENKKKQIIAEQMSKPQKIINNPKSKNLEEVETITKATRAMFGAMMFMQKIVIYSTVLTILWLIMSKWRGV
ncbi:MAG: hypothetical protein IPM56_10870 [Ignavibacteriales bacterium]|nr:MAG: hypothetical protein IPM56_10870 [Ignavibacteriales bacterium]